MRLGGADLWGPVLCCSLYRGTQRRRVARMLTQTTLLFNLTGYSASSGLPLDSDDLLVLPRWRPHTLNPYGSPP